MPEFDPRHLQDALAVVPTEAWSRPSSYDVTKVHHGYRRVVLVSARYRTADAAPWRQVLDAFDPVYDAWLSWIDPGGFIVPHQDAGPWRERWQLPIRAAGEFHAGETFTPTDGRAFPVRHWLPHAVTNRTDRPRIHLVVDRDCWVDRTRQAFALHPIPDDMTALVRRSLHGTSA